MKQKFIKAMHFADSHLDRRWMDRKIKRLSMSTGQKRKLAAYSIIEVKNGYAFYYEILNRQVLVFTVELMREEGCILTRTHMNFWNSIFYAVAVDFIEGALMARFYLLILIGWFAMTKINSLAFKYTNFRASLVAKAAVLKWRDV